MPHFPALFLFTDTKNVMIKNNPEEMHLQANEILQLSNYDSRTAPLEIFHPELEYDISYLVV